MEIPNFLLDVTRVLLSGITGGLIASMIFFTVIRMHRPKLTISPYIAKTGKANRKRYVVKILNKGKRSIVNLKFELLLVTKKTAPSGMVNKTKALKLEKDSAFILYPNSKIKQNGSYARRIYTKEDLDRLWSDDSFSFLIFRVYGCDKLSGFTKIFEQKFYKRNISIKSGEFHSGDSFEIS